MTKRAEKADPTKYSKQNLRSYGAPLSLEQRPKEAGLATAVLSLTTLPRHTGNQDIP